MSLLKSISAGKKKLHELIKDEKGWACHLLYVNRIFFKSLNSISYLTTGMKNDHKKYRKKLSTI